MLSRGRDATSSSSPSAAVVDETAVERIRRAADRVGRAGLDELATLYDADGNESMLVQSLDGAKES